MDFQPTDVLFLFAELAPEEQLRWRKFEAKVFLPSRNASISPSGSDSSRTWVVDKLGGSGVEGPSDGLSYRR